MRTVTLLLEHWGENYDRSRRFHDTRFRRGHMRLDEMKKHFGGSRKPWVARITGLDDKYGFEREFVEAKRDLRRMKKKGERGIFHVYHLRSGAFYEVCHWTGWDKKDRYLCHVRDGKIIRYTKEVVTTCLNEGWE